MAPSSPSRRTTSSSSTWVYPATTRAPLRLAPAAAAVAWSRASTGCSPNWTPRAAPCWTPWRIAWSTLRSTRRRWRGASRRRSGSGGLAPPRPGRGSSSSATCSTTLGEARRPGRPRYGRASRSSCRAPASSWAATGCSSSRARRSRPWGRRRCARSSGSGGSGASSRRSSLPAWSRSSSRRSSRSLRRRRGTSRTRGCAGSFPVGSRAWPRRSCRRSARCEASPAGRRQPRCAGRGSATTRGTGTCAPARPCASATCGPRHT
mmetsp:Transcript_37250/g.105158  ORF Transcript_37250/g.105158 Transcript_37250/m.105158 type:complete len:263 (+) Transcript_37250:226-1014(+)